MTTREIVTTINEMYGADVSATLIPKVTDAVIEQVIEWPSRPLDAVYPIIYLDCEDEVLLELDNFSNRWDDKYPQLSRSWRSHWYNLNTLFGYPEDIRRAIYTTNAIESMNSVVRKAIKKRKLFPTDDSAMKVVYLTVQQASKKWTMPIRNWKPALNRLMVEFEDRLAEYI